MYIDLLEVAIYGDEVFRADENVHKDLILKFIDKYIICIKGRLYQEIH